MTAFDIYSAVGGVGEDILEESEIMPKKKITKIIPLMTAAACFAVFAAGLSHALRSDEIEQPVTDSSGITIGDIVTESGLPETGTDGNEAEPYVTESTPIITEFEIIYTDPNTPTETVEMFTEPYPAVTEETTVNFTTPAIESEEVEMPVPFVNEGGDLNADFYATVNLKIGFLDMSFINLVGSDEFEKWIDSTSSSSSDYTSIADLANLYSFIKHFNISDDFVRETLVSFRNGSEDDFSDEEIDLIISGDDAAVAAHFAADTTIVKGSNIYSLKWIYYHSQADYAANGITAEELKATLPMFDKLALTDEARQAIEKKINSYN